MCDRQELISCMIYKTETGRCRETNLVYETSCTICKKTGETVCYIGETGRSLFERLSEHLEDTLGTNQKSHMKDHIKDKHPDIPLPETAAQVAEMFEVKIVEKYCSSLSRQIGEAIHIRGSRGEILNDREEFNRCELPMLCTTKPKRKPMETEKDREIGEETEKTVMRWTETKSKRRGRDRSPTRQKSESRDRSKRMKETGSKTEETGQTWEGRGEGPHLGPQGVPQQLEVPPPIGHQGMAGVRAPT